MGWLSALFIAACVVEPTDSGGKDSVGEDSAADTDWLFVAGYTDVNAQLEQWKYGAGLGDPQILYATEGSGAWWGYLTW